MASPDRRRRKGGRGTPGVGQLPPTAVVSAATRLRRPVRRANGGYDGMPVKIVREEWGEEAWRQYDLCPEMHVSVNQLANAVGRCRLTICPVDEAGVIGPPTDNPQVLALGAGLLRNPSVQKEFLTQATLSLTVAGDGYVLTQPDPQTSVYDDWCVLSTNEISIGIQGEITVNRGDEKPFNVDTDQAIVFRMHRPHPRRWWEADSPVRAALIVLRELEELSKYLFATVNSRLAGAGILGIPSEATFATPVQDSEGSDAAADTFIETLTEGMLLPIEDMSNPAALVPIVIQAPRDALGGIQWLINPNSQLPTQIESLRDAAIARLRAALDLPTAESAKNHWGEWALEEKSIKFHIEPIIILIVAALNEGYFRAALEAAGLDPNAWTFWYDPSDLINRPDKSTDAKDLYDRGELSGAALRRESGFTEADAPTDDEKLRMVAMKLIAAAPAFGETLIPHLLEIFGLDKVVKPEDLVPRPSDGTPAQPDAPPTNTDPKARPEKPTTPPVSPRKDSKTPEAN